MKTETETAMDRPLLMGVDVDRSNQLQFCHQTPGSYFFKQAHEEAQEPIIGPTSPVLYDPSNRTLGDTSFYINPGSLPSLSSMAVITCHSYSSSPIKPDLTTSAPPAVLPVLGLTPLSTPPAPKKPTVSCLPREETLEVEGVASSKFTPRGGQGSPARKTPKSVSRLCFPFVTTSPKRKDTRKLVPGPLNSSSSIPLSPNPPLSPISPSPQLSSSSPPRHKYACAPTQFSPFPAKRVLPVQKHRRHVYPNRGYSHEALGYVKSFWTIKSGGHSNRTNIGVAPPVAVTGAPVSNAPTAIDPPEQNTVPASIHPRHGDISALRNPQCAEIDKSFSGLGIWTIAKAVWMAEVVVGMGKREMEDRRRRRSRLIMRILWDEDTDGDGDESPDLLTRSTSSSSLSDDSEMTLVEDDSVSASFLDPASDGDEEDADDGILIRGRKFTPQAKCSSHSTRSGLTSPQTQVEAPKSQLTATRYQSEWATDWLSRWDVIRNLSEVKKSIHDDRCGGYDKLLTNST